MYQKFYDSLFGYPVTRYFKIWQHIDSKIILIIIKAYSNPSIFWAKTKRLKKIYDQWIKFVLKF